ncbi:MAG: Rrf2 family transcriptional regulator [Bryobacterales bacterium]|nr:Rrf2 family transcriptional regulator [Bryobacterales bacterium]
MLVCSRACAYAIRALARLARQALPTPLKVRDIAAQENIPSAFLAKVLHQLVRAGLVSSSPGLAGGFRLRVPAERITLLEIVEAVDGLSQFTYCFTGLGECNEQEPCPMHESWKNVRASILDYLRQTTLAHVAEAWARRENLSSTPTGGQSVTLCELPSWRRIQGFGKQHAARGENLEDFSDFQWPLD